MAFPKGPPKPSSGLFFWLVIAVVSSLLLLLWGWQAGMGDIVRDVDADWDQDSDWDQELEAELDRTVMEFLNEDSETEEGEDAHG